MSRKLTPKQAAFVVEYLVDLNATKAAERAGYSKRTARSQGQRLLTHVDIAKAIGAARVERQERTEITQDFVLHSLKAVVERCMEAVPVLDSEGQETGYWRFNAPGANKALELLGRHLGMFRDRECESGEVPVAITVRVQDGRRRGNAP